ncbi:MAG: phage holin family protein [Myxococcota bacterium]
MPPFLISFIAFWLTATFALFVADKILSKMEIKGGLVSILGVGAVYAVALKGIQFVLGKLDLLLTIGTLGLYKLLGPLVMLIVMVFALKLADRFSDKLSVETTGTAFMAALIMAVVTGIVNFIF